MLRTPIRNNCIETEHSKLKQIAVLDNGHGMNKTKIRRSLLFGSGDKGDSMKDIGKYGMGLPNSSLSQCRRVDVYSWQNYTDPIKCYIDIDEIKGGNKTIPEPRKDEIPDIFKISDIKFSKTSGTLVLWSKLDRCSWVTSKATLRHSEFLIGRIYRRFLNEKKLKITTRTIKVNDSNEVVESPSGKAMLPNDPMYLMAPSSTPGDWANKPMFQPNALPEKSYAINFDGKKHVIKVRYSIEKDELRDPATVLSDPGNADHGQHARKNTGVSIMRSDREITLDTGLVGSIRF